MSTINSPFLPYTKDSVLKRDLFRKVQAYFEMAGLSHSGGRKLALKIATVYSWFLASYLALLFSQSLWMGILSSLSLGLAIGCVGTCVMHESNHGACFQSRTINRLLGYSLDLIGGSSYYWRWSHGLHHRYPNVENLDYDIDIMPVLRLAPWQKRRWAHRYQHNYVWLLFTLTAPKWNFIDDYRDILRGRIGKVEVSRPSGIDLAALLFFKLIFYTWAFVLPILILGLWRALGLYVIWTSVTGIVLGGLFQLGHLTTDSKTTESPSASAENLDSTFIATQILNTANFRASRLVSWYAGGLNYQIEHHLFPHISHVHYPALASIVEDFCRENDIQYCMQKSLWSALKAHRANLKALGQND